MVIAHDFEFLLHVSDGSAFEDMLDEVAGSVLRYVGCSTMTEENLVAHVRRATAPLAGGLRGACDVQFRARGAELAIVVTAADGRVSRLVCEAS